MSSPSRSLNAGVTPWLGHVATKGTRARWSFRRTSPERKGHSRQQGLIMYSASGKLLRQWSLADPEERDHDGTFVTIDERIIATFQFKYRTIGTLRELDILHPYLTSPRGNVRCRDRSTAREWRNNQAQKHAGSGSSRLQKSLLRSRLTKIARAGRAEAEAQEGRGRETCWEFKEEEKEGKISAESWACRNRVGWRATCSSSQAKCWWWSDCAWRLVGSVFWVSKAGN